MRQHLILWANKIKECPINQLKLNRDNLNFFNKKRKVPQTFYLNPASKVILAIIIKIAKEIQALIHQRFIMNI